MEINLQNQPHDKAEIFKKNQNDMRYFFCLLCVNTRCSWIYTPLTDYMHISFAAGFLPPSFKYIIRQTLRKKNLVERSTAKILKCNAGLFSMKNSLFRSLWRHFIIFYVSFSFTHNRSL